MHDARSRLELTHHATLLRGDREECLAQVSDALGVAFRSVADPDIAYVRTDALSIDDVRSLALRALQKPVAKSAMTFIVDTDSINTEAQHALLKLTEDPPKTARFVFVIPRSAPLLPTLRSRFMITEIDAPVDSGTDMEHTSLAKTFKDIARMAKDKDEAGMERMLRNAERGAHEAPGSRTAGALMLARRYIETRGASPKMLLEHLAIAEKER